MPLSDIDAHCEKDQARMDSEHEKMDRMGGGKEESQGGSDLQSPSSSKYAPQPRGPGQAIVFGAIAAVTITVLVLVLALLVFPQEESPTDVYRKYVKASNDREVRVMFDQTVTKFTSDYEARLENLSLTVFVFDPVIEIIDLNTTNEKDMTPNQKSLAQLIIIDAESRLSVQVDDYCYLNYRISINYRDLDQTATFDGMVLCGKIDGHWLLIVPGYF